MKPSVRAAIAFIVGNINGRSNAVYDYSQGRYVQFSGRVTPSDVSIFDNDDRCHISGSGHNGEYRLFHYGNNSHIHLTISGNNFKGFDYGSNDHFSGTISNRSINLYDFGSGKYFSYMV
jgi:hypothetical protein